MNTKSANRTSAPLQRLRVDKWLWAARFYKTRSLAVEALEKKRVLVNDAMVKPSKEVHAGDVLTITQGDTTRTIAVLGLSEQRGSATLAALLYQESEASIAQRLKMAELRRLAPEPAHTIAAGGPTKRDRRENDKLRRADWNERWSATID